MKLRYFEFDRSDDTDGHGNFDAMAAVGTAELPALKAELCAVLHWAEAKFGPPGPLDDGAAWDCALQGVRERSTRLEVCWTAGQLSLVDGGEAVEPRTTLSLSLSGSAAFCAALQARLELPAD